MQQPDRLTPAQVEELRVTEVLAAFKGFASFVGPEEMAKILDTAESNKALGLKGVTIPSDDGSFWVTIDEQVSFAIDGFGPYILEIDEAQQALGELRQEQ